MIKVLKQLINNLNWYRRDSEYKHIEKNYRRIIDLPRETNIEDFQIQQIEHDWEIYRPYFEVLSSQGHSGGSASIVLPILTKLLNGKPLSPLTSNKDEWKDVSDISGYPMWQNKRDSEAFSKDFGQTWVMLEDKNFSTYFKEES